MNNELERTVEGSGRGPLKVLALHLCVRTEEIYGSIQSALSVFGRN
jgi:hypothetical protein